MLTTGFACKRENPDCLKDAKDKMLKRRKGKTFEMVIE